MDLLRMHVRTMLGFFCSCIYLESEDSIPLREIIFYIFIAVSGEQRG